MKTNFKPIILLCAAALFPFASCRHKELCRDHTHGVEVQVVFDWEHAPDAHPSSMRLYLFPEEESDVLLYEFANAEGGRITVPAGVYKALCLNSDTESVLYRNIGLFASFEAYAPDGALEADYRSAPRAEGAGDERMTKSPDRLWSARDENVHIGLGEAHRVLTFFPEESVCRYRIRILHADNLRYISSAGICGSLSGMSGGLLVGPNRTTAEPVTVPFHMTVRDSTTLETEFLCFGHCSAERQTKHKVIVYAILDDGGKHYYTYDVTSLVHEAQDCRNVTIELDGLPLPTPITDGSGFRPSVDVWDEINENISM
ncbi:MAG TPA: DUF5119 domain-containing protein [Candidatus Tidjanibacter gallistercoris]|nr:DUF5119 domain-containing protein [Candidatus Tidjanibacter gallistercoris]